MKQEDVLHIPYDIYESPQEVVIIFSWAFSSIGFLPGMRRRELERIDCRWGFRINTEGLKLKSSGFVLFLFIINL